jgi:chromosome segregation ATPase
VRLLLEKEERELEEERNSMLSYIEKVKNQLTVLAEENKALNESTEALKQENKGLKKKLNSLLKINNEPEITKDQNTFWTNEESNISEELDIFNDKGKPHDKLKMEGTPDELKLKPPDLSNQIAHLHQSYNREISTLKEQIKGLQKGSRDPNPKLRNNSTGAFDKNVESKEPSANHTPKTGLKYIKSPSKRQSNSQS